MARLCHHGRKGKRGKAPLRMRAEEAGQRRRHDGRRPFSLRACAVKGRGSRQREGPRTAGLAGVVGRARPGGAPASSRLASALKKVSFGLKKGFVRPRCSALVAAGRKRYGPRGSPRPARARADRLVRRCQVRGEPSSWQSWASEINPKLMESTDLSAAIGWSKAEGSRM